MAWVFTLRIQSISDKLAKKPAKLVRCIINSILANTDNKIETFCQTTFCYWRLYMKLLSRFQLAILTAALAAGFAGSVSSGGFERGAFNGGHGFGYSTNGTRLSANLSPATGSGINGRGAITYRNNNAKGNINIGVTLSVDGKTLIDPNAASTGSLSVSLSKSGTQYASCSLAITNIYWNYVNGTTSTAANYQAIINSGTSLSASANVIATVGNCVNINSANTIDLPQISAGDTANVILNSGANAQTVLSGLFM